MQAGTKFVRSMMAPLSLLNLICEGLMKNALSAAITTVLVRQLLVGDLRKFCTQENGVGVMRFLGSVCSGPKSVTPTTGVKVSLTMVSVNQPLIATMAHTAMKTACA